MLGGLITFSRVSLRGGVESLHKDTYPKGDESVRFSFIPNGYIWQQFVSRLFVADNDRSGSSVKGFKTISAERLRDYGLDGFRADTTGTVFQTYFPLWEHGEPRYKRVNRKLDETCRKLEINTKHIEAITGASMNQLILVIPEDPDAKIREHQQALEERMPSKVDIWGETQISELLSRHISAVKDFLPFQTESVSIEEILKEAQKQHNQGNFPKNRCVDEEVGWSNSSDRVGSVSVGFVRFYLETVSVTTVVGNVLQTLGERFAILLTAKVANVEFRVESLFRQ